MEFPLYCVDSFICLSIVLLCKEYISSCMIVILTSKRKLISGKDTKEICQSFFYCMALWEARASGNECALKERNRKT